VAGIYGIVRIVVPPHYAWNVAALLPAAALIVTGVGYSLIIAAIALVEAVPGGFRAGAGGLPWWWGGVCRRWVRW